MRITTNGVSLYYEVEGSGPALILLHGNGEDHTIFDRASEYLRQMFTLYLVDSRGHGQSSPVHEYHYQDMVDDLAEFIRKLKLDCPAVCGFSDGAIVGLMFASQHPGVLSRLIACGANTRPETLKGLRMALDRLGDPESKDPKVRMMLTEPDITAEELAEAVRGVRELGEITYLRGEREKRVDLSATLVGFSVRDGDDGPVVELETRSSSAGALRPRVLLDAALGAAGLVEPSSVRVRRKGQWHEEDGCLVEPFGRLFQPGETPLS